MTVNTGNFPFAIKSVEGEIGLGYTRLIVLEHNDIKYNVSLKWDVHEGFEVNFIQGNDCIDSPPDWFEEVDLLEFDEVTEDLMPKKEMPPTAADQFVHDYLLVTMNDYGTYQDLMAKSKEYKFTQHLADRLEEDFEESVCDIAAINEPSITSQLLREMLLNQGTDVWYRIAKAVKDVD